MWVLRFCGGLDRHGMNLGGAHDCVALERSGTELSAGISISNALHLMIFASLKIFSF
jgi:hypothetical protein